MHTHSCGSTLNLHVSEISFSRERMGTKTHFEKESKRDSEIMVGDYRHNSIFDFLTCYYILHSNEFFGCLNFMLVLSTF